MKPPRRRTYRDVLNERGVPNEQVVRRDSMPHRPPDARPEGQNVSKPPKTNIN
jgi:hypothetical protein